MNNFFFIIIGYLLIFISILLLWFRLQRVKLTIQDYGYWRRVEKVLRITKERVFKIIKISEHEFSQLSKNFFERILRRIKIEALKIETWANKKLENLKIKDKEE